MSRKGAQIAMKSSQPGRKLKTPTVLLWRVRVFNLREVAIAGSIPGAAALLP